MTGRFGGQFAHVLGIRFRGHPRLITLIGAVDVGEDGDVPKVVAMGRGIRCVGTEPP
jgi:hypothetical protein